MGQSSFDFGYIGPNQSSNGTLSGPGVFSLSSRSNVPYVALVGRSGFFKQFSWGEIVEIPQGEQCTVKNASYHGGDVIINGGADYDTRPAAITVPVPVEPLTIVGEGDFLSPVYPADCRMARRAFIAMDAESSDVVISAIIIGKRNDGSHNTLNEIAFEPGTGYEEDFLIPINTAFGLIPLGKGAVLGDDSRPMALLTTARPYFEPPDDIAGPNRLNAYYVLEY